MPYRDRAQRLAYLREYHARHAERMKEQNRLYRLTHREEIAARWREWHAAHPEAMKAATKKARDNWVSSHRDEVRAKVARRRAVLARVTTEKVLSAEVLRRSEGVCGICGGVITGPFDVDHIIPLARGGPHSYANTQAAHPVCNRRKRHRLPEVPA